MKTYYILITCKVPYVTLKKFDDAESITKKMIHKYPGDNQYVKSSLGDVYTQSGDVTKANTQFMMTC